MSPCVVIGIGHPDRGDDAVGRIVAAGLAARVPADVAVREHDGETAGLLEWLGSAETVILVDAAMSGEAVGTIRRFDVVATPLPGGCFVSTHGMGLAEAVELARVLGQMPGRCIVYAIEARAFEPGAPLSPEVAAAVDEVVARVLDELADIAGQDAAGAREVATCSTSPQAGRGECSRQMKA